MCARLEQVRDNNTVQRLRTGLPGSGGLLLVLLDKLIVIPSSLSLCSDTTPPGIIKSRCITTKRPSP